LIVSVGSSAELEENYIGRCTIDATGKLISPGLVDPHTHLIHGGTRESEWGALAAGRPIPGGIPHGIVATQMATQATSTKELSAGVTKRLNVMLAHGTTTVEAKSGYGVAPADEIRLLRVLANVEHDVEVIRTYLGAHVSPGPSGHMQFVDDVIKQLEAAREFAEYCDVCCDPSGFTVQECERIAAKARTLGFDIRVHADQTGSFAGAELAIRIGAASADHLEYISDEAIELFAESNTVAILLPTVSYHSFSLVRQPTNANWLPAPHPWLGQRFRELLDRGALAAIATDYNPGSSPALSMQTAMETAARMYRLSYAEIWHMSTINGAYSLGRADRIGSLEVGKQADIVVWDVPNHELVINQFGTNLVETVFKKGKIVHPGANL
jgi:imidazolonepropionase